jgi:hypothetical protein
MKLLWSERVGTTARVLKSNPQANDNSGCFPMINDMIFDKREFPFFAFAVVQEHREFVFYNSIEPLRDIWMYDDEKVRPFHCDNSVRAFDGGPRAGETEYNCQKKKEGAKTADPRLDRIEPYRVFSGIRHAPLFTQIGLIVGSGLLALGLTPIGLVLFLPPFEPYKGSRRVRLCIGILFCTVGLFGFGLLSGIIFLS